MSSIAKPDSRDEQRARKLRLWRRRVLQKKGALLHARMLANKDEGTLAMLDEDGVVVSWYGDSSGEPTEDRLLGQHVSQFYLSNDIALGLPMRDLCTAAVRGVSTQLGWRRAADGSVAWASTQIDSELLGDGRLQGFAHVIRRAFAQDEARDVPRSPLGLSEESPSSHPNTIHRWAIRLGFLGFKLPMSASA